MYPGYEDDLVEGIKGARERKRKRLRSDSEDGDGEKPEAGEDDTHRCAVCGYTTRIDTPHDRTENFCQGECETFTTFRRL